MTITITVMIRTITITVMIVIAIIITRLRNQRAVLKASLFILFTWHRLYWNVLTLHRPCWISLFDRRKCPEIGSQPLEGLEIESVVVAFYGQKIALQKWTPQKSSWIFVGMFRWMFSGIFQPNYTFQWVVPKDCYLHSGFSLGLSNACSVAFSNDISLLWFLVWYFAPTFAADHRQEQKPDRSMECRESCNQWNRSPRPQLEPQITGSDKCKIDWRIVKRPVY